MSRFFWIIQPSNGQFFSNMFRFFLGYPTIQQGFLHTYHTGPVCHPSIQRPIFQHYVLFFWGHPIIQQGFPNIYQTFTFWKPSNSLFKNTKSIFSRVFQPSNGLFLNTMFQYFWMIKPSSRGSYTYHTGPFFELTFYPIIQQTVFYIYTPGFF